MQKIGYHGTSHECAQKIKDSGFDINLSKEKGWLGKGIYFFQATGLTQGYSEACNYAKANKHIDKPEVLQASIQCENKEEIVDLLENANDKRIFDECRNIAVEKYQTMNGNAKGFDDAFIFALIDREHKPKIIRALIDAHREKRYTSFVVRHPELIICVKDTKCIKDVEYAKENLHG